jgi:hypothetical protein
LLFQFELLQGLKSFSLEVFLVHVLILLGELENLGFIVVLIGLDLLMDGLEADLELADSLMELLDEGVLGVDDGWAGEQRQDVVMGFEPIFGHACWIICARQVRMLV